MIFLRSAELADIPKGAEDDFPFRIPLFQNRPRISFENPVTIIVGENGSGKSTLIEAIATAADARTIGSQPVSRDPSLAAVRKLGDALNLVWSRRTNKGFFLRAEDFFGFVKRIDRLKMELEQEKKQLNDSLEGRSDFARQLALSPYLKELAALKRIYGDSLDLMSHGERFLQLFQSRLTEDGLYLLDEPEAPLSPLRQLALIAQIKDVVAHHQGQFIIATHSPILMAYPGAAVLEIIDGDIVEANWSDLEHVTLTRDFLNDPDSFLRHL